MSAAEAPACDSQTVCFKDTARGHDLDYDPGWSVDADWVIFGMSGDSIELRARLDDVSGSVRLSIAHGSGFGYQERDSRGNTAPYSRFRTTSDGVVMVSAGVDDGGLRDTVDYTLSLRRLRAAPLAAALTPTGETASLTISSSNEADRIAFIPVSVTGAVKEPSNWTVFPRRYKVVLVPDSLYVICKMPCTSRDTIKLMPSTSVVKKY